MLFWLSSAALSVDLVFRWNWKQLDDRCQIAHANYISSNPFRRKIRKWKYTDDFMNHQIEVTKLHLRRNEHEWQVQSAFENWRTNIYKQTNKLMWYIDTFDNTVQHTVSCLGKSDCMWKNTCSVYYFFGLKRRSVHFAKRRLNFDYFLFKFNKRIVKSMNTEIWALYWNTCFHVESLFM